MATVKQVQVEATLGPKFKIESQIREHKLFVDQPASGGGENAGPTPLEYLFLSLAGCIATIGRIAARQRRIELRGMTVRVEGDLDLEVLMGKPSDKRAGFTGIKVIATIDADISKQEKEEFLHEVDRRCPVSENIRNLTPMQFEVA
jgi:putative redox protein